MRLRGGLSARSQCVTPSPHTPLPGHAPPPHPPLPTREDIVWVVLAPHSGCAASALDGKERPKPCVPWPLSRGLCAAHAPGAPRRAPESLPEAAPVSRTYSACSEGQAGRWAGGAGGPAPSPGPRGRLFLGPRPARLPLRRRPPSGCPSRLRPSRAQARLPASPGTVPSLSPAAGVKAGDQLRCHGRHGRLSTSR